jgi:hypothetical protein
MSQRSQLNASSRLWAARAVPQVAHVADDRRVLRREPGESERDAAEDDSEDAQRAKAMMQMATPKVGPASKALEWNRNCSRRQQ